jgi:hypothetical protein
MKIKSIDGVLFKFEIKGYEFPLIKNGIDSNWLKLNVQIHGRGINLNETDPCIQSSELGELIRWLMRLMLGKLEPNQFWEPVEGNFTFEYGGKKENVFLLRIYPRDNFSVGLNPFSLEFLYTDKEISKLIQSLIKFQRKYPVRDELNTLPPHLPD